jgi:hypothetical protein
MKFTGLRAIGAIASCLLWLATASTSQASHICFERVVLSLEHEPAAAAGARLESPAELAATTRQGSGDAAVTSPLGDVAVASKRYPALVEVLKVALPRSGVTSISPLVAGTTMFADHTQLARTSVRAWRDQTHALGPLPAGTALVAVPPGVPIREPARWTSLELETLSL